MGVLDFFRKSTNSQASDSLNRLFIRPVDEGYVRTGVIDVARVPFVPLGFEYAENLFYNSDVLRTVVRSIVWETFRNGIYIEEKFLMKCTRCKTIFEEPVEICPVCGSTKLRPPNKMQRERLEQFLVKANLNEQTLLEVLQDIDFDLNIFDNAFIVVRKEYYYDDKGNIIGAEPIEIIRGSPRTLRLVMSDDGRLGINKDGTHMVFVCPEHREKPELIPVNKVDPNNPPKCPRCGKQMIVAHAEYRKASKRVYLGAGEVLHVKKFTHGIGYGYPMPLTLAMKILILMKMDYYVLMAYHIQRPPKGILILRANRDAVAKAWQTIEEATRVNPWKIVPLVIEGTEKLGAKRIAEWIDMSFRADETVMMSYRDELRRSIGMAYGVSPIFQGDMSVGSGLANEGLQITVTNRAVEREQTIFNDKILPWIVAQLGVTDYVIKLKPHEEKDLTAQLQREMMRIQKAQQLIQMGYKVKLKEGPDGIDFEVEEMDVSAELMLVLTQWLKENNIDMKPEEIMQLVQIAQQVGGVQAIMQMLQSQAGMMGAVPGGQQAGGDELTQMLQEVFGEGEQESPLPEEKRESVHEKEQRFEGEPDHSKPRKDEQRFEGEPTGVRR